MPTYVYEVIDGGDANVRRFEVEQRMSDAALTRDPATGRAVRRVISGGLGFVTSKADDLVPCASGGCLLPRDQVDNRRCGR